MHNKAVWKNHEKYTEFMNMITDSIILNYLLSCMSWASWLCSFNLLKYLQMCFVGFGGGREQKLLLKAYFCGSVLYSLEKVKLLYSSHIIV